MCQRFGKPKSPESIIAGLAYDEKGMGPNLFLEAAKKNGINAQISQKTDILSLSEALLPCVLILESGKACVLLGINTKKSELEIFTPALGVQENIPCADIIEKYKGHCILVKPTATFNPVEEESITSLKALNEHWFWSITKQSRSTYTLVIFASLFINLFALVSPLFIMNVYDRVIPNNTIETGWALGLGALVAFVFDFIFRTLRGYFIDFAGHKTDVIAARKIYDHLLDMKLADRPKSSGAFANMLRDFDSVREFFTSATITVLVDLPFTLLFLFFVYQLGGHIAFIILGIIGIALVSGLMVKTRLKKLVQESNRAAQSKHGQLVETINGLEAIKTSGFDGRFRARYSKKIGEDAQLAQKSRFLSAFAVNFATFWQQAASVIIILNGMYLVQDGDMTVGGLIACVILGGRAIAPIGQFANLITRYHQAGTALKTLDSIMASEVERPAHKNFLHRPELSGALAFEDVHFAYPESQVDTLKGVSFVIKPGEKVGIIGRVGSGKSTIAKMLLNLYEPKSGCILADETDYRQIDPADLRRNIAYIAQDVTLFQGSIRDNITMGAPQASEEDLLRVATASGVHDFVSRHPMGYDAPAGEGGSALSGGQRQSIALARAMISNPNIVICDEPTNAMDVQSENAFCKYVKHETKGKTFILITHKHSMLSMVDRLILVHGGKIIMDGRRDDVIAALQSGTIKVDENQNGV